MKKVLTPLVLIVAMIFASCSKDEGGNKKKNQGDPVDVIVNLVNSPVSRGLNGTEDGVGDENKITVLEFFVFNEDGDELDPETGGGTGYVKMETSDLTHRIRVSTGDDKLFLVVANSNIGVPAANATYTDILEKITQNSYPAIPTLTNNPRKIFNDGFEMSGIGRATVGEGSTNQVYVVLTRTVSKITTPVLASDIPVELGQQEQLDEIWDPALGVDTDTDITFTFDGWVVANGAPTSNVGFVGRTDGIYKDPVGSTWDDFVSKGNIKSKFLADGQYEYNYSGPTATGWFLDPDPKKDGPVYVYESMPADMNTPGVEGYRPSTVYAYIIEGTLTPDHPTAAPQKRYWRVNLGADEYYHIMRNCVYKVSINKITTPGYGTPEEAEDEKNPVPVPDDTTVDFFITIAQWDINEYETDM